MKKSIIFILPDLETGGAERIITTIANHLSRDKFSPSILLLRKEGAYLDFLKPDIEIIDIQTPRIRHSLKPILLEIKRKPDIVFSGFGEVNAYLSLFIKLFPKTKFIARETNVVSQHVTRKEIRFFYKFYNNYDRIIAQSNDMQTDLIYNFGIRKNKLIKINNPVDIDFIEEKLKESEKTPTEFSPQYKHVVAIGNLSARKGFDNLLKAFSRLKNQNILLHILGDGKDKEMLLQMKQMLGLDHVIFHGKKSNPYQYLKYADLFILSSRYEGFPNVLLEAGACGVYSLVNNCPGGIDEIIIDQINGEIANVENYDDFAEKLKHAIHRNDNKEDIKTSIKSRFSKDIILKKYEDLLWNL